MNLATIKLQIKDSHGKPRTAEHTVCADTCTDRLLRDIETKHRRNGETPDMSSAIWIEREAVAC